MTTGVEIRKQRVGDKHVDTANYNNMVEKVNFLSLLQEDLSKVEIIRSFGGRKAVINRGSEVAGLFSGRVWSIGTLYTGLDSDNTKPWVKIPHDGSTPTEEALGPGSPAPDNATYIEKEFTYGDFHLPLV